jgi:RNA polymerase sigma-70 factor (sigma-E family)
MEAVATDGRDFVSFVRANTVLLLRTAYLLTGSSPAAEELVQDTLVRLYPKWDRVSAADVPIAYVRRSLANAFVNERRRPANRELVLDVLPERHDAHYPAAHDPTAQFADRDELWGLLRTLPDRQRAALVMRYFEDLPDDEIGNALGCRAGTVRSLISRGLAALRENSAQAQQQSARRLA